MKLLNKTELKELQAAGKPLLFKYPALLNEFADRLEISKILFDQMTPAMCEEYNNLKFQDDKFKKVHWKDDDIPDKIYGVQYTGPAFSYDLDYMAGPLDWHNDHDAPRIGDHVLRRKIYIEDTARTRMKEAGIQPTTEMEYFMDLLDAVKPIFAHYNKECFVDDDDDVKFYINNIMLIEYSTPYATDETVVEHRKFNTERFGQTHCDEVLFSMHLGETIIEFQTQNNITDDWSFLPDSDTSALLFGEFAESYGWNPTYHQMIHNTNNGSSDKRYVILVDYRRMIDDDSN